MKLLSQGYILTILGEDLGLLISNLVFFLLQPVFFFFFLALPLPRAPEHLISLVVNNLNMLFNYLFISHV